MGRLSRRTMLSLSLTVGYNLFGLGSEVYPQSSSSEGSLTMDKWLGLVLHAKSIDSPLYMGRFKDPMYFLLEPISWTNNFPQASKIVTVTVPKGFVTDLASIPALFYTWLRPDGNYAYAAIIHDYLYWQQDHPKKQADDVLRAAMEDLKVDRLKIEAIYQSVSWAGQPAWDENSKLKQQGEKRILKRYPLTADITWGEWQKQPDVFL
jgi:hypothetical protein